MGGAFPISKVYGRILLRLPVFVLTLVDMTNAGRLDKKDVRPILYKVLRDYKTVIKALVKARSLIDDYLINSIVKKAEERTSEGN